MSGGFFNYGQFAIREIAEDVERLIESNDDESLDRFGERKGRGYPPDVIERFKEAAHLLNQAADMAHRIDWLVSCDDGENTFLEKWKKEVRPYWNEENRKEGTDGFVRCPDCSGKGYTIQIGPDPDREYGGWSKWVEDCRTCKRTGNVKEGNES